MKRAKQKTRPAATALAAIERFNFHGDDLEVVPLPDGSGDVGVGVRRMCECITLDPDGQIARLARAAAKGARWATTFKMEVVAEDGKTREMVVLPRRSIPMFLATVSIGHVDEARRPEMAVKIAAYQDECADVLADRFLGRRRATREDDTMWELVTGLYGRLESLETKLVTIAASGGTITGSNADWIRGQVDVLAAKRVMLGYSKTKRSAVMWLYQHIAGAVQWGGSGAAIRHMPAERLPMVKVCIEQLHRMLDEETLRRDARPKTVPRTAQSDLFQKAN
jgi:hypothetical protein